MDRPAEHWTCASKFEGKAITCLKADMEGGGGGKCRGRQSRGQQQWGRGREQRGLKRCEGEAGRDRERPGRELQRQAGTGRDLQGQAGTGWTRKGQARTDRARQRPAGPGRNRRDRGDPELCRPLPASPVPPLPRGCGVPLCPLRGSPCPQIPNLPAPSPTPQGWGHPRTHPQTAIFPKFSLQIP